MGNGCLKWHSFNKSVYWHQLQNIFFCSIFMLQCIVTFLMLHWLLDLIKWFCNYIRLFFITSTSLAINHPPLVVYLCVKWIFFIIVVSSVQLLLLVLLCPCALAHGTLSRAAYPLRALALRLCDFYAVYINELHSMQGNIHALFHFSGLFVY